MLLYIVRHGHPDYVTDSLTDRGWLQAEAVGKRLAATGIDQVYASPMGRARQTAEPTCRLLDLPCHIEPWAHEVQDERLTDEPYGKPTSVTMVQIKTPDLGGVNNTIEAVLYCKEKGIGAYQGGTCNETDRSAQVCVHCAMATQPAQILAKPGMGVDEGFMIVYNEMNRILAIRNAKRKLK